MGAVLFAVSDKTRWKILEKISTGAICACELPAFAHVSQPAVSQHLKVLREAKLVRVRTEGVKRIYSLSDLGERVLVDVSGWEP